MSLVVGMASGVLCTAPPPRECVVCRRQYHPFQSDRGTTLRSCGLFSVNAAIKASSRIVNPAVPLVQALHNMALPKDGFEFAGAPFLKLRVQLLPDAFQCCWAVLRGRGETCAEVGVRVGFEGGSKGSREDLLEGCGAHTWGGCDRSLRRRRRRYRRPGRHRATAQVGRRGECAIY